MKPLVRRVSAVILLLLFWCLFDCSPVRNGSSVSGKSIRTTHPRGYLKKDAVYMLTDSTTFATDEQSANTMAWGHFHNLVSGELHFELREAMLRAGKLKRLEQATEFRILAFNNQTFLSTVMIREMDSGHTLYFSPWEYLQSRERFVFPFERMR